MPKPLDPSTRQRRPAGRFLAGLAARSAVFFFAIVGLNLVVDPLGVYGSRLFEPIVLRTRAPKLYLYERVRPAPDVVVLGSSRSFEVEPSYIAAKTSRSAFNASTAGAGIRDYLEFARCFAVRGRFPSLLIVAFGVEQTVSDRRGLERNDLMDDCLHPQRTLSDTVQIYRGLFTPDETWASLRVLGLELTGRPAPARSFGHDGMIQSLGGPPSRQVLEQRLNESLAGAWAPGNFAHDRLSSEIAGEFRQLLELCRDRRAKVIVYLPPYHPKAVALYLKESRFASARSDLLERLAAWATEYPLRFHDFSEVTLFGGREDMFSDASHPTAEADRLMLDIMLADGT